MKTILLIGRNGQVGHELVFALAPLGRVIATDRSQLDLGNADSIRQAIRDTCPEIIVNAAGYTSVDGAETEPALAMQVNAMAPGIVAEEALRLGALLVHFSTDYVFDGTLPKPYVEEDLPNPLNAYGRSKLAGEYAILATGCAHLILRASWIYSERGTNFVLTMLKLARARKELLVVDDQIGSPSWARVLALTTAELLSKMTPENGQSGVYHFSAPDSVSRFDFAKRIIAVARAVSGDDTGWAEIRSTKTSSFPLPAARPLSTATSKDKVRRIFGVEMPSWENQIDIFMRQASLSVLKGFSQD